MNKNIAYSIGGALLAFIAGGASGYFAADKRLEKKHAALFDDAIKTYKRVVSELHERDLIEYYEKLLSDGVVDSPFSGAEETPSVVLNERPDRYKTPAEAVQDKADSTVAYHKIADEYKAPATKTPPRTANGRFKAKGPYIIDEDDYTQNPDEYDQVTLTYYAIDQIFAEDDTPYEKYEEHIGLGNINELTDEDYDSNVMLIRNDVIRTDFEIIKTNSFYSETVVGMTDE